MSYIITFFVGAILGGASVWIYRAQISDKLVKLEDETLDKPPAP